MIKSREDYRKYYIEDCKKTGIYGQSFYHYFFDIRYRYYKNLRKCEYYINCKTGFINKVIKLILLRRHYLLPLKTGWIIPPNVFGKGLSIIHIGPIVVSSLAKVGDNCRIHVCLDQLR